MRTPALLLVSSLLLGATGAQMQAQRPDSVMTGSWEGRAQIDVPWTLQRELLVRITIRDDGSVAGTVGDAILVGARFSENRGRVARALRLGREYAIDGRLSGPVIRAEALQRATVHAALDWNRDSFVGELQTSGTYDGSPADLILSAKGMVLRRVAPSNARIVSRR